MPATPLHWVAVWPLLPRWRHRLDFAGLTVGAVVPDLEIPFYYLLTGKVGVSRGIMHSFLGAVTLDIIVGSLLAVALVPWFIRRIRGREYWGRFVEHYRTPKTLSRDVVMASVALGAVSHVVLDLFTHTYNPVFWPFPATNGILLLGALVPSSLLVHAVLVVPFIWLLRRPASGRYP